jgi:hypothetical protein
MPASTPSSARPAPRRRTRHCVDEHCDGTEPPPASCEERCEDHSQHDLRRCLAEAGRKTIVRRRAREQFQGCVAIHCQTKPSCEAACDRRAEKLGRRCLKRGGSEEECAATVEEASAAARRRSAPRRPRHLWHRLRGLRRRPGRSVQRRRHRRRSATPSSRAHSTTASTSAARPPTDLRRECEEAVQERFAALSGGEGNARLKLKARKAFRRCMRECASEE